MRFIVLLVLLGCGCPPKPPVPPQPPLITAIPVCRNMKVLPDTEDVCIGLNTAEGFACAYCQDAHGCVDERDMIYCIEGTCVEEPRCHLTTSDDFTRSKVVKHRLQRRK